MPAERRFGMDHEHYDWSPLNTRGVLRWPENARVALCVIVNLEHMEWTPPQESYTSPLAGGPRSPAEKSKFALKPAFARYEFWAQIGIKRGFRPDL